MTTKKERLQEEAKKYLLDTVGIKPGDTIYTQLRHVSRSGMCRCIALYVIRDNEPWDISWNAATLLEGFDERHYGCKAGGCGMDGICISPQTCVPASRETRRTDDCLSTGPRRRIARL